MDFIFDALIQIRGNAWKAVEGYTEEQLNKIPEGFGNNIAWNLGHMVASQQSLCYRLANVPMLTPDSFLSLYKKGTSPKNWTAPADMKEIKAMFEKTNELFYEDYKKGVFANYTEYKTSSGIVLKNINDALIYNYGHENLHYGVILSLRKLVK
jgi:hypothetical protein